MIGGDKDLRIRKCYNEDGEYKCDFEFKDTRFTAGVTIVDGKIAPGTKMSTSEKATPTDVMDKAMAWLQTEVKR